MAVTVCTFIQICANVDSRQCEIIILHTEMITHLKTLFLKQITPQSKKLLNKQNFFIL